MAENYNSKDIVILEGLDAVRLRPGMYIGTTGIKGMHHLLWEIVDNSIDEIANGYGDKIVITMHTDNSITVKDNGRGIPVDKHPTLKVSGVQVVFTQLHAGGKFNNSNYSYSGGLHGVGASVTNALSEWLKVEVCREGQKYAMQFKCVKKGKDKYSGGVPVAPLQHIGPTDETGTTVTFKPDDKIFKDCLFDAEIIAKRVRELAFLNKGITIELINENEIEELGNQRRVYNYTEGLKEFIKFINEKNSVLYKEPIYIEAKTNLVELSCAIQHVDLYSENVFSYVNNIPTPEGGMHETGLKSGITRAFNEIARSLNLLKEKDINLLGEDYREGMTVVLAIKMKNVQFEGQTKTKLGNPEARQEVENIIYEGLMNFANQTSSKQVLTDIINKAKGAAKARDAARKAKEITRQKNSVDSYSLVGKLSSCTGRNPLLNEVFIVEGDSAGGSAKQARDRSFQAILPLRGKPLNVEKKRISQVLENEEIRTIISAVGTGIGNDFNIEHLKYNKIIIMADADQDGAHIRAILLTFFYRYMRELINTGHVYVAIAPLYKIYKKGFEKYVYNEEDYDAIVKETGSGYSVARFKGLGEMSAEQLWETTMNPAKRVLVQVTIDDLADAEEMITTLMGDNVEARKKYITSNANFNKVDTFEQRSKKK
ncbi:MAG: DNA gyrase subunit B [Clostridia bacterium]|nr:DNA gyrase subunit B [Clostridia bacterium]